MKHLVFADVHGNLPGFERLLTQREALDAERHVFLGDAIGYNGFPEECVTLLRERPIQAIRGNHEALFFGELPFSTCANPIAPHTLDVTHSLLSAPSITYLRTLPERAILNERAVLVHGSLRSIYERINRTEKVRANFEILREIGKRILFFAHTHKPAVYAADRELREVRRLLPTGPLTLRDDEYYLINPGTTGELRGRDLALSALLYDDERESIQFVFFELSPAEAERLRRRNREVFGPLALIAGITRAMRAGERVARRARDLIRPKQARQSTEQ